MTTYIRCVQTVPHNTGLPEDSVVNTWSFIYTGVGTRDLAASNINNALDNFYTALKANLSSQYAWNSGVREYLDMSDGRPRVPYTTAAVGLGTLSTTANDFPAEVAQCLSMRGALGSGLNAARRRGRVYIGPLQNAAADLPMAGNTFTDLLVSSAIAMSTALEAGNLLVAVYSPYTHHGVPVGENIKDYPDELPGQLDDAFIEVTHYWADNAWDTQRRRGPKATYRKTTAVP